MPMEYCESVYNKKMKQLYYIHMYVMVINNWGGNNLNYNVYGILIVFSFGGFIDKR
jgi:hypothetical protein